MMKEEVIRVNTAEDNFEALKGSISRVKSLFGASVLDFVSATKYLDDVPDSRDIETFENMVDYRAKMDMTRPDNTDKVLMWIVILVALMIAGVFIIRLMPVETLSKVATSVAAAGSSIPTQSIPLGG